MELQLDSYTVEHFKAAVEKEPFLVDGGIWQPTMVPDQNWTHKQRQAEFQRLRDNMVNDHTLIEFKYCCEWLSYQPKRKTINTSKNGGSYYLKHQVEEWVQETASSGASTGNGVLIAATIHMGFEYKAGEDSPNVWLNISNKQITPEV